MLNRVAGFHEISESFTEFIIFEGGGAGRESVGGECYFKVSMEGMWFWSSIQTWILKFLLSAVLPAPTTEPGTQQALKTYVLK